jgi:hypothetical protein
MPIVSAAAIRRGYPLRRGLFIATTLNQEEGARKVRAYDANRFRRA